MKTCLFLLLGLLTLPIQTVRAAGPKVGDKPPLLRATTLLQAPPGASFDARSLRGKVLVLEFWATWCGPCVAEISHLNALADQFQGQPVQFVAITAEDAAVIKPFLSKRPIHAWVALDTDRAMNKAYEIRAIPCTVLVGRDGKIAAITHPATLKAEYIQDLLAGKKINLPSTYGGATVASRDSNEKPPVFEISIRPSADTNVSCASGGGRMTAHDYTVAELLPMAFDVQADRILTNGPLPKGTYDVNITDPGGSDEELSALLQLALKSSFGVTGTRHTNDVEVWLLRVKEPNARGLVISPTPGSAFRYGPGDIGGTCVSMPAIATALESQLKKPVLDDTGLTNRYDVSLTWDQKSPANPDPEALRRALTEQLGLELVPAVRAVEMVRIDSAKRE